MPAELNYRALFEATPDPCLVLNLDLTVVAVNQAYLALTSTTRKEIIGRGLLELYANGNFRLADADIRDVQTSLERVLSERVTDVMAGQQYCVSKLGSAGDSCESRYWSPLNTPVFREDGEIAHIIHRVLDVTEVVLPGKKGVKQEQREMPQTGLAQVEDVVRLSEAHYRILYYDNPTMIVTVDSEFTMLSVNPRCASQLGYTVDELEGQSVTKLFLEEDHTVVREKLQECLQQPGEVFQWQFRKACKDGSTLWVEETAQACFGADHWLNVVIVCLDITQRKQAEEAQRESEERFHAIFNLAAVGIAQVDPDDGKMLLINQKLCDIIGYTIDELLGLTAYQISHPDDIERHLQHIHRLLAGELTSYSIEKRLLHKEGSIVWVSLHVVLMRDQSGRPESLIAVVVDINERKHAEENLRESEEKFYRVFNLAPIGITISTLSNGRFVDINQAGERMSGYRRDEVVGHSSLEFNIWNDAAQRNDVIREMLAKGEVRDREMTVRDKAGRVFWGLFSAVVIEIRGEKHLLSLMSDIGERKKAQERLRESEERFRLLAETAPVMIWETGPDGRNSFFNQAWLEFTGMSLEQALGDFGEGWAQGMHPDDRERCLETYRAAIKDHAGFSVECRLHRRDGQYGWIVNAGVPRLAPDGALLGYLGTCFDVTERKLAKEALLDDKERLEQRVAERTSELRQKEVLLLNQSRLAAMGEMIGNIAHQWRQPLNTLGLHAQEILALYKRGEFSLEYLEASVAKMLETMRYMSQTIDDFRNFFRPGADKVEFRAIEMVEKTISLLAGSLKADQIEVTVVAHADSIIIGNPNEFCQVLLNIMVNAKDAIVARAVTKPRIVVEIQKEGERCQVTITDNAGGIPQEMLHKIFDLYFTTKGLDKGTGVGLFMSKMIVEKKMGGSLSVRNTGDGAQFCILI